MEQETLQQCQELIGYHFDDPSLLATALTHSSGAPTRAESNERLEFLGDAVLGLAVCHELFAHEDELMEGEMTKVKSSVVSRRTCAEVVEALGLISLVAVGKGMAKAGSAPESVAAGVFESILGAIYLDGGLAAAVTFVRRQMGGHIEHALTCRHRRNFKAILQQHAQQTHSATPDYHLLDEKGPDHAKCFEVAVSISGRHYPSAWGMSKKDAEQRAARVAMVELGLLDSADDEDEDFDDDYEEDDEA